MDGTGAFPGLHIYLGNDLVWKEYLFPFCMVRGWAVSLIYFRCWLLSLTNIEAWHDVQILDLQIREDWDRGA